LQNPVDLGQGVLRIGHVLEGVDREHRLELTIGEWQVTHVGDLRFPLLTFECAGVERRW